MGGKVDGAFSNLQARLSQRIRPEAIRGVCALSAAQAQAGAARSLSQAAKGAAPRRRLLEWWNIFSIFSMTIRHEK